MQLHDLAGLDAAVLALNAAHETETSPLDPPRLDAMRAAALYARGATDPATGALIGFLIAFDRGAAYDSPNFRWFCDRMTGFAYIDRIIVAPHARGRGVARALYADLFARAAAQGLDRAVCEVNLAPPNPASDAMHAALGFAEVGRAALPGGKTVRYLARPIAA